MLWEVALLEKETRVQYSILENETRVHKSPSYSLTMYLHGMCPSSTLGK